MHSQGVASAAGKLHAIKRYSKRRCVRRFGGGGLLEEGREIHGELLDFDAVELLQPAKHGDVAGIDEAHREALLSTRSRSGSCKNFSLNSSTSGIVEEKMHVCVPRGTNLNISWSISVNPWLSIRSTS